MDARRGRQLHPDGHLSQHNLLLCKSTTSQRIMLLRLQTHNCVIGSVGDGPTATQTLLGEDTLIGDKRKKDAGHAQSARRGHNNFPICKKEACNIKHKYNILHGQDYAEGILKMNAGFLLDLSISLLYFKSANHDVYKQMKIVKLCLLNTSTTSNILNKWSDVTLKQLY